MIFIVNELFRDCVQIVFARYFKIFNFHFRQKTIHSSVKFCLIRDFVLIFDAFVRARCFKILIDKIRNRNLKSRINRQFFVISNFSNITTCKFEMILIMISIHIVIKFDSLSYFVMTKSWKSKRKFIEKSIWLIMMSKRKLFFERDDEFRRFRRNFREVVKDWLNSNKTKNVMCSRNAKMIWI